ncbi:hypothetical protein BU16DRAFT_285702 [Lophium mytilinum]|uniref:R3H domain-containing protein n=1 Tax=Lophium mytilinum TaxID=390894 RepID=A0A6A6R563_9PEZI|nr:hypothetical protein BU16DRAFT_285702 [Lophium mytilinum]
MSATPAAGPPPGQLPTGPTDQPPPRRRRPKNRNPPSQAPDQPENGQPQRGGRRGRGGPQRGRGGTALTPATVAPPSQPAPGEPSIAEASTSENHGPSRRGRGGRGGPQGRARGDNHNAGRGRGGDQSRMAAGGRRQFGGDLTQESADQGNPTGRSKASGLQADAPEFRPGQPHSGRAKNLPRRRRMSKSQAPDISTRTHEDIDNGHYECAICTEDVRRNSRVWSCRTCWTVFHLSCIKKWSTNEGSAAARREAQDGEMPPPRQWRCPGCNLPKDDMPKMFTCWCEKEVDPRPLPGTPPFSCGQTCARQRLLKKCPHPCPNICHSGPCPPCAHMGPTQTCFCKKKTSTKRCVDTNYESGWSCGEPCGELMPCGEHICDRPCHEGPCGACEVRVPARCYCGQVEKDIMCCEQGWKEKSARSHIAEDGTKVLAEWTGIFGCSNNCDRDFDCGKHSCSKPCHRQDAEPTHCPRSPDVVSRCPCGKTPLEEISAKIRQTCEDPIPNCTEPCGKTLPCDHACVQLCHQEECRPCLQKVSIICRCGRTTSSTICHQGTEEAPQCMRVCRVTLNCGRHECGERCCPGERKAADRQASKRKLRALHAAGRPDDGFEAEHICTRTCDRALKCGNPLHRCQQLCHKGPCESCREAIFDEVSCSCGKTTLHPPLPCGTKPPPCRWQCERPKACGHQQVTHNCHQDEEECPKCPFLTTKTCLCGKNTMRNQPCWRTEARCGEVCGRKLRCGAHKCQKQCHTPGECEEPCQQSCGKELPTCGHACLAPCHSPYPCKEDRPCQHKIFVTCDCQRIKQETKCGASKTSEGNITKSLKCDDECARLERNRKLALALNIDQATHADDHVPYSTETLKLYQDNVQWASAQEKDFRLFAADPAERRLRFKPMPSSYRAFLHALAEDFGFDSESVDPEPHRHVAIFKTPRFVTAPMKTLAECARIRQTQRTLGVSTANTAPPPAASSGLKKSNLLGEPYNGYLLSSPRFGLTIEELRATIRAEVEPHKMQFDIAFLPSEEVALTPSLPAFTNSEREVEAALTALKPALLKVVNSHGLGSLQLVRLDSSLNVHRREADAGPGAGWSQVAARGGRAGGAARLGAVSGGYGSKAGSGLGSGRFTVLARKSGLAGKKEVEVAEDWEREEEVWEAKEEGVASGEGSDHGEQKDGVANGGEESGSPVDGIGGGKEIDQGAPKDPEPTTPALGRWAELDDEEWVFQG